MNPDRLIGVPFINGGYDYDDCHCYGLVWLWFRDVLGIVLPRYDGVEAGDVRSVVRTINREKNTWITVAQPRANDVAVMRSVSGDLADGHVGIVVNKRQLLHTTQTSWSRIEPLTSAAIAPRIIEFKRHPQLAH